MLYDIIIPLSYRDCNFIWRVIHYIRLCLKEADNIYIITSNKNFDKIKRIDDSKVFLVDEDTLYEGLTFAQIEKCLHDFNADVSTGWYFQQFLKYAFAFSKYSNKYYLSWDSDTLPLSHIKFFNENGQPLFTLKSEYNHNYFSTIEKLLDIQKSIDGSFIAEHMLFDVNIVKELIVKIEQEVDYQGLWFEKILSVCDFNNPMPAFSEFETYGTFVQATHPGSYSFQKLNTFRNGGFIKGRFISDQMLGKISFDVDTISFEMRDEPAFPYNLPNKWFTIKDIFLKIRKLGLKKTISKIFQKIVDRKLNKEFKKVASDNLNRIGK